MATSKSTSTKGQKAATGSKTGKTPVSGINNLPAITSGYDVWSFTSDLRGHVTFSKPRRANWNAKTIDRD
jgi:hypothetical protein